MEQVTFKSSAVWVGTEESVAVYPSLEEVPPKLRLRIVESLQSERAVTILIADKQGREELVRRLPVQDSVPKPDDTPITEEGRGIFFSHLEAKLFALVVLIVSIIYFLLVH